MGLSQSDLAEVLDNAVAQTQGGAASSEIHDNHLRRIAETLVVPLGLLQPAGDRGGETEVVASNKAAATLRNPARTAPDAGL